MASKRGAPDQAQGLRERLRARSAPTRQEAEPMRLRLLAPRAGLGRTLVGSLLTRCLVARGRSVLVVDSRPRAPLVQTLGGGSPSGAAGLPGWLRVISSGSAPTRCGGRGQTCDTVLLLGPAGVGHSLRSGRREADGLLIVAGLDHASISEAYSIFKRLVCEDRCAMSQGPYLVLSRASSRPAVARAARKIDALARRYVGRSFPLVAATLEDPTVQGAGEARWPSLCDETSRGLPVVARAMDGLAAEIDRALREREARGRWAEDARTAAPAPASGGPASGEADR